MGGGASSQTSEGQTVQRHASAMSSDEKYNVSLGSEPHDLDTAKKQVLTLLDRVLLSTARFGSAMQADESFVHQCGTRLSSLPLFLLAKAALPLENQVEHLLERMTRRQNGRRETPKERELRNAQAREARLPRGHGSTASSPRSKNRRARPGSVHSSSPQGPQSGKRPFRRLGGLGASAEAADDGDSVSSADSGVSEASAAIGEIARRAQTRSPTGRHDMTKRSTGSLEDLLRSAAEIAGSSLSNVRELSCQVARRVVWLLNAERCSIWIKDPGSERLFAFVDANSQSTSDIKSTLIDVKIREIGIPLVPQHSNVPVSVEQAVYSSGQVFRLSPLTLEDAPGVVEHHERGIDSGDAMYVPIIADRQVYGVCKVLGRTSDDVEFVEDDENLLATFIVFVAVCFKNALLYKDLNAAYAQTEVLLELTKSLSSCGLDVKRLCNTIIQAAKKLLNSDRCALFLVDRINQELVAQFEGSDSEVRLPIGKGIAGHVAQSGEVCNIRDAYSDTRFNKEMDRQTGYKTDTILCAPIRYEGEIVAVAQLVNKRTGYFTLEDEETFDNFGVFSGINIRNCMVHQEMLQEKKTVQAVLKIVAQLQEVDITKIGPIMMGIMNGAKELAGCDRCALFLVDKERNQLVAKVASGAGEGDEVAIRVKIGEGIAGTVAQVGEKMNVKDAYSEPKFNKETDRITGYVTKTILAMPVKYKNEVIAVTQLVNKKGDVFGVADESRLHVFTQFAGMCLRNAQLVEFMKEAEAEQRRLHEAQLAGGVEGAGKSKTKFAAVTLTAVQRILGMELTQTESDTLLTPHFNVHEYNINSSQHERLVRLAVEIFDRLGMTERFNLPRDKMTRLILTASMTYRHVPYHNFTHAFDVAQTVSTFLMALRPWDRYLTEMDALALLFAALFHDIDHMGLNNSFQLKAETPLGVLSSSSGSRSVLEVHHCNLTIDLMSNPDCNIFCNLTKDEQRDVWKTVIDAILATDMARHNELSGEYTRLAGCYDSQDATQRRLLVSMMLKAADISNITRPFDLSRVWAQYVTAEFYYQGDAERHLGLDVTPMFDRQNKSELATGQIGFMKGMGVPYFTIVTQVLDDMKFTLTQLLENLATWERLVADRKAQSRKQSGV
eukprot:TRINITY_DN11435_c0_g1_i1.p1 TRINITY_DN11435_c0_g1~~TRINITY_DN11435_c0_g1_i1.p1  ORF type:complete len:1120 (+),score=366.91 TRINITY_DN11435_c0_g1_i1:95-3454(+)